MTTTVSVFGLGYVGCVSAACLAKEGFHVVGVDVAAAKVDMVNRGVSTIVEEGIAELVADMVQAGRLSATTDVRDAVRRSSIAIVCVGTPSRANGGLDLSYVERVMEQIGECIRDSTEWHTVVLRSTVLPGTTAELVVPALERASGKRVGRDFGIAMNPEFLREGTSIRDFYSPPFTLVGADDERTATAVQALYAGISAPVHVIPLAVAEMIKYASNAYHGLKVGFANEIGRICKAVGVDSHEVMRIFSQDTKLNVSAAYLRPGYAFGGSCLPKDLRALAYRARQLDVDVPLLNATLASNERQIARAFDMVRATGAKRVGVLGLAFKAGTDDLRESPIVALVERLIGKGTELAIYDRDVSRANLVGSNREYIEREIPHIWSLMKPTVDDVLSFGDAIVIGNATAEFRAIQGTVRPGQVVLDLVRAFDGRRSGAEYQGIAW
jgi:GDP-mannose 6-dehydrogenase